MRPPHSVAGVEVQNEPVTRLDLFLDGVSGVELDDVHLSGASHTLGICNLEHGEADLRRYPLEAQPAGRAVEVVTIGLRA